MGLDVETSCPAGARPVAISDHSLHQGGKLSTRWGCLGTRPRTWFPTSPKDMINGSLLWVILPPNTAGGGEKSGPSYLPPAPPPRPWRNSAENLTLTGKSRSSLSARASIGTPNCVQDLLQPSEKKHIFDTPFCFIL